MLYQFLTDFVVVIHFAFVLFVVLGALLAVKYRWLIFLHVPAAVWGALIEFKGWLCPLTPLENLFRQAGGRVGYADSFIEHYLTPIIYPAGLTRGLQIIFGLSVVVINTAIYTWLLLRWCHGKRNDP